VIGETIGHFKVVSRLGRGGMGEVYAGEHESIQTRVAIKVLHHDISQNTDHVQRFFNEAKIVGRIKHAGIVKIFDVGFQRDQAYLIMELLEGEPLSARIARGALPWQAAVDIGRQIASVLDATHRAGVIHRDLKPDNIFLVPDHELASGERVKVLDFGISKLSGTISVGSPKTIGTMGTPTYMAPEQWGDSGNVDWRADAYSLGCAMFEMVCGRPPFVVETIADACAKHLQATPPRARTLASVPASLDGAIARLLAKQPADRAPSMGHVARELAALAAGNEPVPAVQLIHTPPPPGIVPPTLHTLGAGTAPGAPPALTTLGASAAQIVPPKPKGRRALVAGLGAGVLAVMAVAIVLVARPSSDAAAPAAQPAAQPAPQPVTQAAPPPPPPPPPPAAATPAPPPPEPTPVVSATAPKPERKKPAPRPKPAPTVTPAATAGSGSAAKDPGFGGRI
jgi:eukaryotic-like serine/threonine-protein kinase